MDARGARRLTYESHWWRCPAAICVIVSSNTGVVEWMRLKLERFGLPRTHWKRHYMSNSKIIGVSSIFSPLNEFIHILTMHAIRTICSQLHMDRPMVHSPYCRRCHFRRDCLVVAVAWHSSNNSWSQCFDTSNADSARNVFISWHVLVVWLYAYVTHTHIHQMTNPNMNKWIGACVWVCSCIVVFNFCI